MRLLNDIVGELNTAISGALSYGNNVFNKVCVLHEKDGKNVVITREGGQEVGALISPREGKAMTFYHRIINEQVDSKSGKGTDVILMKNTDMRLVGIGIRKNFRSKTYWDNDEIVNEVMRVINKNPRLSNKETVQVLGYSSDMQEILDEELNNPDLLKKYKLELAVISVDYRIKRRINCVPATPEPDPEPLLNQFPDAYVAYSLRSLKSTTASVIRARRVSDDAEQDFTATEITDGTLLAWAGTEATVRTWYDQSGNGYDLEQTSTGSQPFIVESGALIEVNCKPSVRFDGKTISVTPTFANAHPFTIFSVHKQDTVNGSLLINDDVRFGQLSSQFNAYAGTNLSLGTSNQNQNLNAILFNTASSEIYVNNSLLGSGNVGSSSLSELRVGRGGGIFADQNVFTGKIQELVIFSGDESANLEAINTEINTYYSIY